MTLDSPLQGGDVTCVSSKPHRDAARWVFTAPTVMGTQAGVGSGPNPGVWLDSLQETEYTDGHWPDHMSKQNSDPPTSNITPGSQALTPVTMDPEHPKLD